MGWLYSFKYIYDIFVKCEWCGNIYFVWLWYEELYVFIILESRYKFISLF